ncbi:MAG: transcriptional regulator [Rhodobacteraceae bacterium]|nr:MAG: transcriptional regulator [Paracoccaceae bacterium]
MKKTKLTLPSAKTLHALEAIVRLGTATCAANELSVTQAAISHRIRDLEDQVGEKLFTRHGRRLVPTPAAHRLAEAVRNSAYILESVLGEIQCKPAANTLTISMLPALASKWLAPRLADMLEQISSANLKITASRDFVDFQRDGVDVAIRYGAGNWPQVRVRHLANEVVAPVMAPSLAAKLDLTSPKALCAATLLRCDNPDSWEDWFAGSELTLPANPNGIFFDEDATMIEAAIAGQGVALGRFALVAHDVRAGRLVAPFRHRLEAKFSYWYVQDLTSSETKSTLEFFHWARAHLHHGSQLV